MSASEEPWNLLLKLKDGLITPNEENTLLWAMHDGRDKPPKERLSAFDPTNDPTGGEASALGLIYLYNWYQGEAEETDKAIPLLTAAHEAGNVHGTHHLAKQYKRGKGGLAVDFARATELFTIAHKKGYVPSGCFLGFAYAMGQGVPQSEATAVSYYRGAAQQGYRVAQKYLGAKLLRTSPTEAAHYLRSSIAGGSRTDGGLDPMVLLRKIHEADAEAAAPKGDWQPLLHRFALPDTRAHVLATLLMAQRRDALMALIPRDILVSSVLFYVCCRPWGRTTFTPEMYAQGETQRAVSQLKRTVETRMDKLDQKMDSILRALQQLK